jgi:intein/homing endonuclease
LLPIERKLPINDIEKAKSNIRTLTLKQEISSMVLQRLFEAEDESEITKEERVRLSTTYEEEMKQVSEELKQSELVVSLAELETIREDIIKKFEATLNQTQEKIDLIIKELKIEEPAKEVEEEPKQKTNNLPKKRRVISKTKAVDEAIEVLEDIDEVNGAQEIVEGQQSVNSESSQPEVKMDVEARLNKLKQEVLKELDELDKLELEA